MTVPPPDAVPPTDEDDGDSVPVTVETVLGGSKTMFYASFGLPLLMLTHTLRMYLRSGSEIYFGIFIMVLSVLVLMPLLYMRFLPGMIERRRHPTGSPLMEIIMLSMLWVAGALFLLVGVWDLRAGALPLPLLALHLVVLVPPALGTEAFVRERRWRS
ncbi:hypothetical protein [Nocardiopsis sp. HUAS JQ3]|uniref:hypothetical protein n=1 Tax=Nocardiopsis sp. HUAS JQ3 TaxID=3061629 RepID=UPI0023A9FACC|nr:hypothetical protein [Nocardiopsis sp. HUAS JQ3]WDZ89002.1 hypothetical protein PV789_18795 [Nocardiopsis sp. HUAS JQ3]